MARMGRYKIPRPFKDEDIWFRYFTKKQLFYLAIFGGIGLLILSISVAMNMSLVGGFFCVCFVGLGVIIPRFNVPDDKYLWGGGLPLDKIFFRVIVKTISKKVIYIKKRSSRRKVN